MSQLRKLIAFDKEQKLISDNELTQLAKILKSKPTRPKKTKAKTVKIKTPRRSKVTTVAEETNEKISE